MCEPATWLAVGSLVLGAAAGVQQASAQRAAGRAEEAQAKENAKIANAQARNTELQGQIEEDRRRQQTRAMLAKQRTAIAANNVDMSSGSASDLLGDTAAIGEQDALTIRANAARQAWGYKVDATNSLNQGSMAKAAGKNAATGTLLTTAANTFSGAASVYSNSGISKTKTGGNYKTSIGSKTISPKYSTTG